MAKNKTKPVFWIAAGLITLFVAVEISEAARWNYHAWRRGWVTVWGTRNCRRATRPLMWRRYMNGCQRIGGYLPWYCNDWLVRHEWGPPCYNVTWRKYVARPCPISCWRRRWVMGPLDEYFGDYIPYHYGIPQFVVPSLGDPNGHLTGNQELYIFVDLGQWLDGTVGGGIPYTPLPDGADPNDRHYDFSYGQSPDLPGFTVMRVEAGTGIPVEDLIVFNPDADPNGYPFEVTRTDLLFNGRLYLLSDETFDSEEYNGYLMQGDINLDGVADFTDFAEFANVWMYDINSTIPPEGPVDP